MLTIDPGTKCLGWALWDNPTGILQSCGLARVSKESKKKRTNPENLDFFIRDMIGQLPSAKDAIVELPRIYPKERKVDPNDLINLAAVAGAFSCKAWQSATFVTPRDWKGTVPKELCHKRAIKALGTGELSILNEALRETPESLAHNLLDAVAIGVYWSKKYGKR
jgi:hypothetical protein